MNRKRCEVKPSLRKSRKEIRCLQNTKQAINKTIEHVEYGKRPATEEYANGYLQALHDVQAALNGEKPSGKYWVTPAEMQTLKEIIDASDNIVFFGGAGVSTESGIPDFRSVDGLYNQQYDYPPEVILSATFFQHKTADFYKFYRNKMIIDGIKPNAAHFALAKLEREKKLKAIITQNIDGLHQAAGSENVLELHGSVHRNFCTECNRPYDISIILEMEIPLCECGGLVKPDVVLYEESLNQAVLAQAVHYISQADVLIIGGTSLSVYPAASLIYYYGGDKLILINNSETSFDARVNLLLRTSIGYALGQKD